MHIPLKTTTNPGSNNGFTVNVTIKAKKQGEIDGLTAQASFSLKYDNSTPTAAFGTKIASSGTIQVSETSFTDPALIGKTNINTSTKFFASGEDIAITGFDRSIGKVTLYSAPAHPTKGYLIYSPIEYLRPDGSGKVGVFGAAYDVGAGVEKVKVNYNNASTTEIVLESPSGVQTDVGNGDVNFVTWKGELNVSSIADGKGKIVIIPIDRANNEHAPIEVPVKLKKDSLKINSVELGTDINRNAAIANDGSTVEIKTLVLNYDAANPEGIDSEKYDWHGKADAGTFRFKNDKSHIKIGTGGGSGTKKYTLKCLTNGQDVRGLTALPSNGVITLNADDFTKIGQSEDLDTSNPKKRKLLLTVWDSAQGLTAGTDTWKAELTFEVFVDTIDRVQPTNTIDPFKWDSESKNSLYGNSRANGHIEIGTGLPSAFTAGGTGLMDRDDKVSGKISITGTAHDDQVITEIWAKIDGFTFTGGTLGTGDDAGYTKVATFASGSFAATGNFNDDGWHFSVKSSNFSVENGHTVEWKLNWNTEKLTGGVGLDKKITIKVKDTNPANAVAKERKVDVVPYITGITTALTGSAGIDFDRSALGFYPVYAGEKITLKGFNIKSSPSVKLGAKDLTSKVSAYDSTAGTFDVEIEDAADVKTGELTVTVGGIKAINNDNKNPVIGTDGTVTAAAYNAWQNRANKRLADDLKLSVWKVDQFDSGIQKDITSPMLKIAPDSTWYMSYGKGVPEMVVNKNGTETTVDYSFNKFNNTAVAFDSTGNIYAVGTNTDRIDDSSAKFSFYSRAEPKSSSNSDYTEAWIGKSRLEKVFNQGIYNINRVPRPKLVVTGNTTLTKVYISYFDANHVKNPVKFRYGKVDGSNTFTDGIADGGGTDTSANAMDSLPNGSAPNYHTIADDDSAEYKGGPYVAHGVTSSGVAVVAWYDASKKRLVYSYNTAPQTAVQGGVWQTNAQVIDSDFAGWYVDLAVDEKDGIHIAYYSSSKGDLKYAYLPKYDKSATVVTVDSYLSVGTQISISTRNEGNAATPKIVPYISYFQSAFTQTPSSVRVAWLPKGVTTTVHGTEIEVTGVEDGAKDELFTGNWEVMTIPMSGIVPKDETICNGVPTSGGWANTVVLGFMSDDGYKKAVLRK